MTLFTNRTTVQLAALAEVCADTFNVPVDLMRSKSRVLNADLARHAYCLYANETFRIPKSTVAKTIGRTTNAGQHSVTKASGYRDNDPIFRERYQTIQTKMNRSTACCPHCEGKGWVKTTDNDK